MRIIISPAKAMHTANDAFSYQQFPVFMEEAQLLLEELEKKTYEELKAIWSCSDKITTLNAERVRKMNLRRNLTPAILAYDGIQYKYMAPIVFENKDFEYIEEHLRILSGFYGILRPFDGVTPYRLEMQAKIKGDQVDSLYDFWGSKLADRLCAETDCIINLASEEYSKAVYRHLTDDVRFITCVFGEMKEDKVIEKGTLVKMARGEMVRFMAEKRIEDIDGLKSFDRLGYAFQEHLSDEKRLVFVQTRSHSASPRGSSVS